jgi:hypothetical protein
MKVLFEQFSPYPFIIIGRGLPITTDQEDVSSLACPGVISFINHLNELLQVEESDNDMYLDKMDSPGNAFGFILNVIGT